MSVKRTSKSKRWIFIGIIAIAILGAAAAYIMRPVPSSFESVNAKTGEITNYYSFSGNVETKNRQSVMSEEVMQMSEIKVKNGDVVKEGDVLIKTKTGDEIKAKIGGEIANINVEENAQVMGGIKLMEIVDYNNLQISVKVDEYDLSSVKEGKETTVYIGSLKKEIKGTISSISKEGQAINGVTFFTSVIDLKNDDSLKIGMSAEVKLQGDKAAGVVTLPMTALQFDDNNIPYVLKKGENDTAVKTEITTGINDGVSTEIKSGVSTGETILYKKADAPSSMGFPGGGESRNGLVGGNS